MKSYWKPSTEKRSKQSVLVKLGWRTLDPRRGLSLFLTHLYPPWKPCHCATSGTYCLISHRIARDAVWHAHPSASSWPTYSESLSWGLGICTSTSPRRWLLCSLKLQKLYPGLLGNTVCKLIHSLYVSLMTGWAGIVLILRLTLDLPRQHPEPYILPSDHLHTCMDRGGVSTCGHANPGPQSIKGSE